MAISTIHSTSTVQTGHRSGRSVLRRAFDGMVAARARYAKRQVNGVLLSMDDATLGELGYDRTELMREGAGVQGVF